MANIHQVAQFHQKFMFPKQASPAFLKDDFMAMRLNFLLEELQELAEASGFILEASAQHHYELRFVSDSTLPKSMEETFDALIDLTYVALGTADLMGFTNPGPKDENNSRWQQGWDRVHAANMAKERVKDSKESSRGFHIDMKKPAGWVKPQLGDLVV